MNPISVGAITGRRNTEIVHGNSDAVVELQMALRAILDSYTGYRYIEASVESKRLLIFIKKYQLISSPN